jgi:hypothetical protein
MQKVSVHLFYGDGTGPDLLVVMSMLSTVVEWSGTIF